MQFYISRLTEGYKKIEKFSNVIAYFATQEWKFDNLNTLALWDRTNTVDRKIFDFNLKSLDWSDYFYKQIRGVRVYIGHESFDTVEKGIVKAKR